MRPGLAASERVLESESRVTEGGSHTGDHHKGLSCLYISSLVCKTDRDNPNGPAIGPAGRMGEQYLAQGLHMPTAAVISLLNNFLPSTFLPHTLQST